MNWREQLRTYVGSQMQICNVTEKYLYHGQIEQVSVENDRVRVRFLWLARAEGDINALRIHWVKAENAEYVAHFANCEVSRDDLLGSMSLFVKKPFVETACFLSPKEHQLKPSEVDGLEDHLKESS